MHPAAAFYLFTQRDGLHGPGFSLPLALTAPCLDFAIS
jgi:hypothetical protein